MTKGFLKWLSAFGAGALLALADFARVALTDTPPITGNAAVDGVIVLLVGAITARISAWTVSQKTPAA